MSIMRRLLKFRLRSLFITMSVLAAAAAFVARPIQAFRQEREALSQIPGTRQIAQPELQGLSLWRAGSPAPQPAFLTS